ncbi:unnamed protein product, partial [Didymodactylos carnosus]
MKHSSVKEADIIETPLIYPKTVTEDKVEIDFLFDAIPSAKVKDYAGLIRPQFKMPEVNDQEIDKYLESLLKRDGTVSEKIEGELVESDIATIDFEGFNADDTPFAGGKGQNFELGIGSGQFIPGFESQLIGMKKGEERTVRLSFPEEYQEKSLAGKPVRFEVKLHGIKQVKLPVLDDEFVKSLGYGPKTVSELKTDLRKRMEASVQKEAITKANGQIAELLPAKIEVEIPDS